MQKTRNKIPIHKPIIMGFKRPWITKQDQTSEKQQRIRLLPFE